MEGDRISCKTFRALEELTKGSDGAVQSTEIIILETTAFLTFATLYHCLSFYLSSKCRTKVESLGIIRIHDFNQEATTSAGIVFLRNWKECFVSK
jgi:hypothetical protein